MLLTNKFEKFFKLYERDKICVYYLAYTLLAAMLTRHCASNGGSDTLEKSINTGRHVNFFEFTEWNKNVIY